MENPDDFTCFCHHHPGRKTHTFWFCWLGGVFFSLNSIFLSHLLPSFGLSLCRAIFTSKTPPPNHIGRTSRNLRERKKSLYTWRWYQRQQNYFLFSKKKSNSKPVFQCIRGTNSYQSARMNGVLLGSFISFSNVLLNTHRAPSTGESQLGSSAVWFTLETWFGT